MNTQLETFDDLEKEFVKNYNISDPVDDNEVVHEELKEKEIIFDEELSKPEEKAISNQKNTSLNDELNEIKSFFVQSE